MTSLLNYVKMLKAYTRAMCCIKVRKVRKALYIASDRTLEFRNEWLTAAAVQHIYVKICKFWLQIIVQ